MVSHNLILKSLGRLNSHLGEPQSLVLGGGPRVHGGEQEGVEGVHLPPDTGRCVLVASGPVRSLKGHGTQLRGVGVWWEGVHSTWEQEEGLKKERTLV